MLEHRLAPDLIAEAMDLARNLARLERLALAARPVAASWLAESVDVVLLIGRPALILTGWSQSGTAVFITRPGLESCACLRGRRRRRSSLRPAVAADARVAQTFLFAEMLWP